MLCLFVVGCVSIPLFLIFIGNPLCKLMGHAMDERRNTPPYESHCTRAFCNHFD